MAERQTFTMTQADYDQIVDRITAARKTSGMFLSGGQPMSNVREVVNDAWRELGRRMGFDAMSVKPGRTQLEFSAEATATAPQPAESEAVR